MNPMVTSRTGLSSQPYVPAGKPWRVTTQLDYASAIEYASNLKGFYLLDAELLRLNLVVTRELGMKGRLFGLAETSFNGAYNGFMDGFFDWYHDLFGFPTGARKIVPKNHYDYELNLVNGPSFVREKSGDFLGDVRAGLGFRHSKHWQTVVSATLPTSSGPDGFARKVATFNASTTLRSDFGKRFTYEGSLGGGYAKAHGELTDYEHTTFLMITQGLRARVTGPFHLYTNLIYHSALYKDTGISELDRRELTLDMGGIFKFRRGPEWIIGLTEDLEPSGPAIDASFRFGARW